MTVLSTEENVTMTKENALKELNRAGVLSVEGEDPETLFLANGVNPDLAVAMEKDEVKILIDIFSEIYETMK